MNHSTLKFTDAHSAWLQWNLLDFSSRQQMLEASYSQPALSFAATNSKDVLAAPMDLVGPTGESNELYTSGRGVVVIVIDHDETNVVQASLVHVFTALLAGNAVIICCEHAEIEEMFKNELNDNKLPSGVLQFISYRHTALILSCDVRAVAAIGSSIIANQTSRLLAAKEGAIVSLLYEEDLTHFPLANDPKLVLRYITERTRTINVTAVGGNATLLELGADSHG